jgi:hypothetical protein
MSVHAGCISVIVKNATLEERFPGGVAAFSRTIPTACTDGTISRVGFMGGYYGELLEMLASHGIRRVESDPNTDVVLFSESDGIEGKCAWLRCWLLGGEPIVWLSGSDPKPVVFPKGYAGPIRLFLWRRRTASLQPIEMPNPSQWRELWKPVAGRK